MGYNILHRIDNAARKKHIDSSRVLPPFKKAGQLKQPSNSNYEPCFGLAAEGKRPNGIRLFFSKVRLL